MDIFLNDTLSQKKIKFKPLNDGLLSMYNCGPTVYDYAHIGNLRSYVFSDIIRRVFIYNNYKINQVINVTDIGHLSSDRDDGEDKMTNALKREGKPLTLEAMRGVANFYFEKFKENLKELNIEFPEHFPFASDHIEEDIELVKKLIEKGFTYKTSDGIYFDTSKYSDYGKLGNIKNNKENNESRIGTNPEKKNQRDFAIWKFNNDLGYEASFGKGFPGWHIECSAMSVKYLGSEFDIHTGGIDHIPVHHNNEIAQSTSAGYRYAKYWMHNAHLNMGGEKMAKSSGKFITLEDLRERKIDPLALRYLFLGARYSSPLQFSWEALEGAKISLRRLRSFIHENPTLKINKELTEESSDHEEIESVKTKFLEIVNDDFDTPRALAFIYEVIENKFLSHRDKVELILNFDKVLGLDLVNLKEFSIPEDVQILIKERDLARKNKDYKKSDELRGKIEEMGYMVKDDGDMSIVFPI